MMRPMAFDVDAADQQFAVLAHRGLASVHERLLHWLGAQA